MTDWNNPFHGDYAWYYTPAGGAAHLFLPDGNLYWADHFDPIMSTALCGLKANRGWMANPANKITQCAACFKKQFELMEKK